MLFISLVRKMQIAASAIKSVWNNSEKRRFLIARTAGNFLVLFALFGAAATFAPIVLSEAGYRYRSWAGVEYKVQGREIIRTYKGGGGNPLRKLLERGAPRIERLAPASANFGIVIPKIGANSAVIRDVDAADEKEYRQALLRGVAHAKGTNVPGGGGVKKGSAFSERNRKIYLFAHSTDNWWNIGRYNAVFFLLKEIRAGDEIDLFYKGRRHIYLASETKIVDPSDVGYLIEPSNEEVLVLQTCWPPGTTLKRLIVTAKPKRV